MQQARRRCSHLLLRAWGNSRASSTSAQRGPDLEAWRTLLKLPPSQHQQAAAFRSRLPRSTHPPHHHHPPHHRPKPGPLRRALRLLGAAVGVTAVAVPIGGVVALVAAGIEDADATELLLSVPRSARTVWWGAQAAFHYKALAARHPDRSSEGYKSELSLLHEELAARLLLLLQGNGGVYIKAGQLAVALRAVPAEYRSTLEVLQDRVPPRPFEVVDQALRQHLGAPAEELFLDFEPGAVAAASLAQVHRARLKDGTAVAVKVQYPGLHGAVMADLTSMVTLARLGASLFPDVNLVWLFEELQRNLAQELDFRIEAANSARLAACLAGRAGVAVPAVVQELSVERVLCMEWVDGCKVSDEEQLQRAGLPPRQVGLALLEAFAAMTFEFGWVHGDPHPGNILVRPDWDSQGWLSRLVLGRRPRPQLVLLDHGCYIELPQDMRQQYCQLWCSFILNDKDTAVQAATALGGEKAGRILPEVLRPRDWRQVSREERRKFRQESGINSFADLAQILEQAPRQLLDALRLSAIVRHTAAQLGATLGDRLRINASAAFRGLQRQRPAAEGAALEGAAAEGAAAGGAAAGVRDGLGGAAVAADRGGRGFVTSGEALAKGKRAAPGEEGVRADESQPSGGSSPRAVSLSKREAGERERQREAAGRRRGTRGGGSSSASSGAGQGRDRGVGREGVEYYGVLQSRGKRWQLEARLWVMSWVFWLAEVLQGLADRGVPGAAVLA